MRAFAQFIASSFTALVDAITDAAQATKRRPTNKAILSGLAHIAMTTGLAESMANEE